MLLLTSTLSSLSINLFSNFHLMIYGPLLFNILFPIRHGFSAWERDLSSALCCEGSFYSGVSSVIACMSLCTVVLLSVSQERQYMVLLLARYVPSVVSQIYKTGSLTEQAETVLLSYSPKQTSGGCQQIKVER